MAVIKAANSKTGGNLKKLIAYVTKEEKTEDKYISGLNCNPNTALDEMQTTKQQYDKLDGREYKHFVQSFRPGEVTASKAHEIAQEWAEKHFKKFEVLIATHQDRGHIHTHFVVNSVSFEDGKKYHQGKEDLKQMKLSSDRICEREGLSVITEKDRSKDITSFNQKKYKAMEKAIEGNYKSYVVNTALAVNTARKSSTSRDEFIKNMESQGYSVKWTDTNKNVTFTDKEGQKVRLSNLQKTFKDERYTKEGLVNEFTRLRSKENTRGDITGTSANAFRGISGMDSNFSKYATDSRGHENAQSRPDTDDRQTDSDRRFNAKEYIGLPKGRRDTKGYITEGNEPVHRNPGDYQQAAKREPGPTIGSIEQINGDSKHLGNQPKFTLSEVRAIGIQDNGQNRGQQTINIGQVETDRSNSSFEHIGSIDNDIDNTAPDKQCDIPKERSSDSSSTTDDTKSIEEIGLDFANIAIKSVASALEKVDRPAQADTEPVQQLKRKQRVQTHSHALAKKNKDYDRSI